MSEYLNNEKKVFVLARKVLDSYTNIAMFIEGARQSRDHSDFTSPYSLAHKEGFNTNLWLRLLRDSEHINEKLAESLLDDCVEIQKMMISSLKTARSND